MGLLKIIQYILVISVVLSGASLALQHTEKIVKEVAEVILSSLRAQFNRSSVKRPPGYRLLAFAEFFYSRKQFEEVLEPTIRDMRDEYSEALAAGRRMKARWVRIRGTWSFFKAAGLTKLWGALRSIRKIVSK